MEIICNFYYILKYNVLVDKYWVLAMERSPIHNFSAGKKHKGNGKTRETNKQKKLTK